MSHIHVHLHTKDAGTSEGAKKAAITRKREAGVTARVAKGEPNPHIVAGRYVKNPPKMSKQESEYWKSKMHDSGTSEGARKAAQTRAQHGGRAGNTASSVGGVLKQHGYQPVMHQGSETFHKHPQHVSSVVTRGESWEHTGYGKGSGAATLNRHLSAHHATHAPASKSEVMKSRLETTNPVRRHSQDAGTSEGARKAAVTRKQGGTVKTARRSFYPASKTSAAPRGMAVSKRQSPSQKHYPFNPRND